MRLRLLDYLTDIQEFNSVSISAKLQCTCGSTEFEFLHTGKQTKGILSPFIVKENGQLILKAICPCCKNSITVYDSTKDGVHASNKEITNEFIPFVAPRSLPTHFSVVIKYNYYPEKLKERETYSNQFENCFIYIMNKNGEEGKALIEE